MRDELSEHGSGTERPPALVATFIPNRPYRTSMVKMTIAMAKAPPPVLATKREPDRPRLPLPKTTAHVDTAAEHIGLYLRKAREQRGEELGDIWRMLKIAEHHLIAIEAGRFDALPGRVYAIGFVRSYAIYLGLDADECVERLKAEMAKRGGPSPLAAPVTKRDAISALESEIAGDDETGALPSESPKRGTISALHAKIGKRGDITALHSEIARHTGISASHAKTAQHGNPGTLHSKNAERGEPVAGLMASSGRSFQQGSWLVTGLFLFALAGSGYYLFTSIGSSLPPPVIPVPERLAAEAGITQKPVAEPPPANVEREAAPVEAAPASQTEVASTEPVPVPVQPAPTIEVAQPPQPVSVPAEPAAKVEAPLPQHVSVPPQTAQRVEGLAQTVSVQAEPAAKIEAARPAVQRYGIQNRNSRITLRVHRRTRVAVLGPRNRDFIDRILVPGDTYHVPNMTGLSLTASDGGAVELVLDGVSVGYAGKNGVSASGLSLNLQSVIARRLSN